MKVGFYYSDPTKQVNKNYPYHGRNWQCWEPPDPDPFDDNHFVSEDGWFVFTIGHSNLTSDHVDLEGELQVTGAANFIMCGFEYGPADEDWYLIEWEMGTFEDYHYILTVPI